MVKNKVLFPVSNNIYQLFSSQVPLDTWEEFNDGWALKIIPTPEDLSMIMADDVFGNRAIAGYGQRQANHTYTFNLRYDNYGYYKILSSLQAEATEAKEQIEMIDFIDPNPEDTQPNNEGVILDFTRRYGAIAEIEPIGSTNYAFTQNFVTPPGQFLKTYRFQGVRFTFEERGIPAKLTITAPGGSIDLFPLRNEFSQDFEGGETFTDGYSQTFVEVERKRAVFALNMRVNDPNLVNTLLTMQASCVDANGVFTPATLEYDGDVRSGAIQQVRLPGAAYQQFNPVSQSQETTTSGFSFRFSEI